MKYLKFIFILPLIFGFPILSCDQCHCDEIKGFFIDVQGIASIHNFSSGNTFRTLTANESIKFSEYASFVIEVTGQLYGNTDDSHENITFINSAYACSCLENGEGGTGDEKLIDISIITLNDFNLEYQANDTINGLYTIGNSNLQDYNDELKVFPQTIYKYIALNLMERPTTQSQLKVKVVMTFTTGEVYSENVYPINLLPD